MTELEEYIALRGKQLKENEDLADSQHNIEKIKGRRREIENLLEIMNTGNIDTELEKLRTFYEDVRETNAKGGSE